MPSLIAALILAALPSALQKNVSAIASNRTVLAEYRQERSFKGLDMKLVVRGTMAYERGKGLVWTTESPMRTKMVMTPSEIAMWDAVSGKTSKIGLSSVPFAKALYECQNAWFRGDVESAPGFRVKSGTGRSVELVADDDVAGALFSKIDVVFAENGRAVEEVVLTEKTGEKMRIVFSGVKNNVPLPASVWETP